MTAVNTAAISMRVQIALWDTDLIPFSYKPRRGINGPCSSSICKLLRNFHSVVLNSIITCNSHQQCTRVPFSLVVLGSLWSIGPSWFIYLTTLGLLGNHFNCTNVSISLSSLFSLVVLPMLIPALHLPIGLIMKVVILAELYYQSEIILILLIVTAQISQVLICMSLS